MTCKYGKLKRRVGRRVCKKRRANRRASRRRNTGLKILGLGGGTALLLGGAIAAGYFILPPILERTPLP